MSAPAQGNPGGLQVQIAVEQVDETLVVNLVFADGSMGCTMRMSLEGATFLRNGLTQALDAAKTTIIKPKSLVQPN